MQKIRKYINTLMVTFGFISILTVPVLAPAVVHAAETVEPTKSICQGAKNLQFPDTAGGGADCTSDDTDATTRLNKLIKTIIDIFSVIVGIVSVIMVIYGGFRYITSGGAQDKVSGAKNTILYAVIGLIVVALAQILVRFVFAKASQGAAGP